MQMLQNTIRAIKHFHQRESTKSQNKNEKEGDWMIKRVENCVECGADVPAYLNFMCEDCWKKALNEKLEADDEK